MASELHVDAIKHSGGTSALTIDSSGNLTASANLHYVGGIIQSVNTSFTNQTQITATTYQDITGASLAITPKFSSSKILIMASLSLKCVDSNTSYSNAGLQFKRDTTTITQNSTDGTGSFELGGYINGSSGTEFNQRCTYNIIDSPNTTSATTYKIQGRAYGSAGGYLYINHGTVTTGQSSIILMEIAQ